MGGLATTRADEGTSGGDDCFAHMNALSNDLEHPPDSDQIVKLGSLLKHTAICNCLHNPSGQYEQGDNVLATGQRPDLSFSPY